MELSIRETHNYVGTYRHLDRWSEIGEMVEIGRKDLQLEDPDDDITEPEATEVYAIVRTDRKDADIVRAIEDSHRSHGCAHEHDCCGCRSYSTRNVRRVTGDLWCFEIHSSRNF